MSVHAALDMVWFDLTLLWSRAVQSRTSPTRSLSIFARWHYQPSSIFSPSDFDFGPVWCKI